MREGAVVRVKGRRGRWRVHERAKDKVGTNWWCLAIDKSGVTKDHKWRGFREADMKEVKQK